MRKLRRLLPIFLFLTLPVSCLLYGQNTPDYTTPEALGKTLGYRPNRTRPLILAHRGGPQLTETENSLETFQHTYSQFPGAILEMDVRMTADSVLVLLHDDEIDRTTTGKGSLRSITWNSARQLFLRDLQGSPTRQHIPRFDAVLQWGGNRVVMAIDAKPGVDLRKLMAEISRAGALHSVFVICYSAEDARTIRHQYPDCWIALGFTEPNQVDALQQSGLSVQHLIALASPQKSDFYRQLHAAGILCTVGTYGPTDLDVKPIADVINDYHTLVRVGADIITTDRPVEVNSLFN